MRKMHTVATNVCVIVWFAFNILRVRIRQFHSGRTNGRTASRLLRFTRTCANAGAGVTGCSVGLLPVLSLSL